MQISMSVVKVEITVLTTALTLMEVTPAPVVLAIVWQVTTMDVMVTNVIIIMYYVE